MISKIIQIGNSQGIRIPKILLEQSGLKDEVELKVRNQEIIIRPLRSTRQGWAEAFKRMNENGDDVLLDEDTLGFQSSWDENEWSW